ncbi:MAG TPA: peptidoglycan recognition family protein [Gaiellaceae bacterium]|nr:peptidoglycan recognition family protein [Gaiellaceae bacterium]
MLAAIAAAVLLAVTPPGLHASSARPTTRGQQAGAPSARRPHIVWKPIPYGAQRKAEMAAYAEKNYGIHSWVLHPKVIVEHYTGSDSFSAAWNSFASNAPDGELGGLPGDCAHFIVDRDGTIYQLVRLNVMCRHTVGLNYIAIGIEHVGTSDREILDDPAQIRSSLALTAWLVGRFHIKLTNVIGHNESLSSPYHKELYKPWAHQTHADWKHADMNVYRAKLRALLAADRRR